MVIIYESFPISFYTLMTIWSMQVNSALHMLLCCVADERDENDDIVGGCCGSNNNTFSYMNRIYVGLIYCGKSFQLIKTVLEFEWFFETTHSTSDLLTSYSLCTYQLYPSIHWIHVIKLVASPHMYLPYCVVLFNSQKSIIFTWFHADVIIYFLPLNYL